VGLERADDAGVYKLSEELAIIQTVDFFTPIVDDPYTFGQIAAANALSDVYAMGGKPLTAMNIVCFPSNTMDISVLREILQGGLERMREAEVVLVGGHSIDDPELKYGLSVTGTIHPERLVTNSGARAGDRLILTKRLGTGIIGTAIKGEMAEEVTIARVIECMVTLNKRASDLMQKTGVNACTDITGFGLIGHACEMIQGGGVGMVIHAASVPVFPEAKELAMMGLVPGGAYRNKEYRSCLVEMPEDIPDHMVDILFDPQTSGGLMISVGAEKADLLLAELHESGVKDAAIIGEVVEEPAGKIILK
jgi:selenide,water dikinase